MTNVALFFIASGIWAHYFEKTKSMIDLAIASLCLGVGFGIWIGEVFTKWLN